MKAVRVSNDRIFIDECGRKLVTKGTVAFPAMYDGLTLRKLQSRINQAMWVLGYKEKDFPKEDTSFDTMWCLMEVFSKLGWVNNIEWVTASLCIFQENTMHWEVCLENACAQLGWFNYKPVATWKELCQNP